MALCKQLQTKGVTTLCRGGSPFFKDIASGGNVFFGILFADEVAYQGELLSFTSMQELERYMKERESAHFKLLAKMRREGTLSFEPEYEANKPIYIKSMPEKFLVVLLPGPAASEAQDKAAQVRRLVERR